jgi:hypothetical protein
MTLKKTLNSLKIIVTEGKESLIITITIINDMMFSRTAIRSALFISSISVLLRICPLLEYENMSGIATSSGP